VLAIGRSNKRVLGVALGDRAAIVAELTSTGKVTHLTRVARFDFPTGTTLEKGDLAPALKSFLREQGFCAARAVFGVPAKWLTARPHTIPPADPAAVSAILQLRAEAQNPAELGDLVLDYAGQTSPTAPSRVLLFGLSRHCLDRLKQLAAAADLKLAAVMPSATALGSATAAFVDHPLVLSVRCDGAELALVENSHTRLLRYLGSAVATPQFATELRRALALLPEEFSGEADPAHGPPLTTQTPAHRELIVWDDSGLDSHAIDQIAAATAAPVLRGSLDRLCQSTNGSASNDFGASAAALALSVLGGRRPAVDFLHPRIVPKRRSRLPRRTAWVLAPAAAIAIAAFVYADLSTIQRHVDTIDDELRLSDPSFKLARSFVNDMRFVESFGAPEPRYLACLRDLTAALPAEGQTYLTRFHLKADMTGEFSGRSDNGRNVIGLLEKLNTGGRFTELRRRLDARGNGSEVNFWVTFKYVRKSA
jgi:hypothetical protein